MLRFALWFFGAVLSLVLAASLFLHIEHLRWERPSDSQARAWISRLTDREIGPEHRVISARREGFIDFSGCVLIEVQGDFDAILGEGLESPELRRMGISCPEGFNPTGEIERSPLRYVGGRQFGPGDFLVVHGSFDGRYLLFYYVAL
ncbi:MAG: hypothetical protein NXI12_01850 [Alphaproteobacteria bacterium]|nr:hypothetical protein [Alphaproteobacteria bacterium]